MEVGFPPPPDEDVLSGLLHALGLDEDDVVVVVVVVAVGPLGLLLLLLLLLPLADGELELQELRKKEKEGKKKENKKRDAMPASVPVRQTRIFLLSFLFSSRSPFLVLVGTTTTGTTTHGEK